MDSNKGGGIGCLGVVAIVFIILKLAGLVTWPWVWVLAPIWIPLLLILVILIIAMLIALIGAIEGRL